MENSIQQDVFVFPASAAQKRLWILSQFQGASTAYHILGALQLKGAFKPATFEKAMAYVAQRQECLRTTFEQQEGEIMQVIHPKLPYPLQTEYKPLQEHLQQELQASFDLEKGPLCRLSLVYEKGDTYLVCCMHHIIADGWSMNIFVQELSAAYNAFLYGDDPALPEMIIRYSDYTLWQHDMQEKGQLQPVLDYWKHRLKDAPALLDLPTDFPRPPVQTFKGSAFEHPLGTVLSEAVHKLCYRHHTTPFITMLAAFKVLLYRYTHQQDITVGTPVANRGRKELVNIMGCFINSIPLRNYLQPDATFSDLLEQMNRQVYEDLDHQHVGFEQILDTVQHRRSNGFHPLFQVMFNLQAAAQESIHLEGVTTSWVPVEMGYAKFDLTLTMRADQAGGFTAIWEYNTGLFTERTIRQMADHYERLLRQVSHHPVLSLHQIAILGAGEKEQLLEHWNRTQATYPPPSCFHQWFEQQAALMPHRTAVEDEKEGLSYELLNDAANHLAFELIDRGLQPGQTVGVSMERTRRILIALLGIMKAGGVYVPIDPAYPEERKRYIQEDAGVFTTLTDADVVGVSYSKRANPSLRITAQDPVYIIYTSGSTGNPKGVRIPHVSLVNFLHSMAAGVQLRDRDRLLAVTSFSFDIAGLELFLPLTIGGTVVIASRDTVQNGEALAKRIKERVITLMQATPATWRLLLEAGWKGHPPLKILCGGEAFPRDLANQLLNKGAAVWNMYGPTETTIWSAMYKVIPEDRAIVPIGRPIGNTSMYILDNRLQPVPIGVNGTLYIGGAGLALDYHNRPSLTAEKFIPDPFVPNARLYNTGDRARYLPDGNILFLGREDAQVKVNGHRIELEEPGYHLSRIQGVKQAVVAINTDAAGVSRLVAYVVPEQVAPVPEQLRNSLLQQLPAYMVPSLFIFLDALPLTPNGKVDRKALPDPDLSREQLQHTYIAPRTKVEQLLAAIWEVVLGVTPIGVQDNFFDLGGASIQSISMVHKAAAIGLRLTPELVFEFPTIAELATKATAITPVIEHKQEKEEVIFDLNLLYQHEEDTTAKPRHLPFILESLAVYLPEKVVSSKEVLEGCSNVMRFPIERLTGVKTRRVAAEDQYAFDLAVKAMEKCFAISGHRPQDIDVLISCNIFRVDQKDAITLEPCTAVRLARHFGCTDAWSFDITNACVGVFTGLLLAQSFIHTGRARRVMLVSGEYLTHVMDAQQAELKDYLDSGIAVLTAGDSGLAMILEAPSDPAKGFKDLDFFTMGAYSDLCIIKASDKRPGFHMWADSIRMMEAGHMETAKHAFRTLIRNRWTPEQVDFLVMHQASSIAITQTRAAINRFLGKEIATPENMIDNIQHRGNTATTTHWVAIQDNILSGRIKNDSRLMLYISGSGLNIGTALYTFDDLPERMLQYSKTGIPATKYIQDKENSISPASYKRVRLAASAVYHQPGSKRSAIEWAAAAATACLEKTIIHREQVGIVCYTGIHRDGQIFEPAIAAMVAGNLSINAYNNQPIAQPRTLCFDVFNSELGFLQACCTAIQLINSDHTHHALISTAEMEYNALTGQAPLLGIAEGGAAWLLQPAEDNSGFGHFMFRNVTGCDTDIQTWVEWKAGTPVVCTTKKEEALQVWSTPIRHLVADLLKLEGLTAADIDYLVLPFTTKDFMAQLPVLLDMSAAIMPQVAPGWKGVSLTLPQLMEQLLQQHAPRSGQKMLLISAAPGGQLGAVIYFF